MPTCSIKYCGKSTTTSSIVKDGITFHRFPKIPDLKEKWINAANRDDNWFPTKHSVICSRHFSPEWFKDLKNQRRLLSLATPTLLLPTLATPFSLTNTNSNDPNIPGPSRCNTSGTITTAMISPPEEQEKRKMQQQIDDLTYRLKQKTKSIKRLQDKNRHLNKKIASLKEILNTLRKKSYISEEKEDILSRIGLRSSQKVKREIIDLSQCRRLD